VAGGTAQGPLHPHPREQEQGLITTTPCWRRTWSSGTSPCNRIIAAMKSFPQAQTCVNPFPPSCQAESARTRDSPALLDLFPPRGAPQALRRLMERPHLRALLAARGQASDRWPRLRSRRRAGGNSLRDPVAVDDALPDMPRFLDPEHTSRAPRGEYRGLRNVARSTQVLESGLLVTRSLPCALGLLFCDRPLLSSGRHRLGSTTDVHFNQHAPLVRPTIIPIQPQPSSSTRQMAL